MSKKNKDFYDDGHTVADMDFENITGYKSKKDRKNHEELRELNLSKKERRAIYKATFMQFMPIFGMFISALLFVILLLHFFWLN